MTDIKLIKEELTTAKILGKQLSAAVDDYHNAVLEIESALTDVEEEPKPKETEFVSTICEHCFHSMDKGNVGSRTCAITGLYIYHPRTVTDCHCWRAK